MHGSISSGPDLEATKAEKERARALATGVFDQDPEPIIQLRAKLRSELGKLLAAENYEDVDQEVWQAFQPPRAAATPDPTEEEQAEQFQRFREAFADENAIDTFQATITEVMVPLEQWGLLEPLPSDYDASFEKIFIRTRDGENFGAEAIRDVADVLITNVSAQLQQSLAERLPSLELAQHIYAWFEPRLVPTLALNIDATRKAQDEKAAEVPLQTKPYHAGEDRLARAGEPLNRETLAPAP